MARSVGPKRPFLRNFKPRYNEGMLRVLAIASILAIGFLPEVGVGQAKPKPKTNPPKPAATAPTKGTVQMPGDNGKVGVTYQLGAKGDELHVTLDSAELATRFNVMEDTYVARANQRLLVLTYTVHNPQKRDMSVGWASVKFTAVSPDDENFECSSYLYHPERRTRFDISLKPAQKSKVMVVFPIHGTGPVTKLIMQRGDAPVVRYDLRTALKPLKSTFSPNGIDLLQAGTGTLNQPFDVGPWDIVVEKIEKVTGQVGAYSSNDEQDLFLVTAKFTNTLLRPHNLTWNTFEPSVTDENGEALDWVSDFYTMTGNKTLNMDVDGGATVRGKWVFAGPKSFVGQTLKLKHNETERTISVKLQ